MERTLGYLPFYEYLSARDKIGLLMVNKTLYAWIARPIVWKMHHGINFTPFSMRDISLFVGGSKCATCHERASLYGMKHEYIKSIPNPIPHSQSDIERIRYLCHQCQRWVCYRCESSVDLQRCCITCISCDQKDRRFLGYHHQCFDCVDRKAAEEAQKQKERRRKIQKKRKYEAIMSSSLSSKDTKALRRSYQNPKKKKARN